MGWIGLLILGGLFIFVVVRDVRAQKELTATTQVTKMRVHQFYEKVKKRGYVTNRRKKSRDIPTTDH